MKKFIKYLFIFCVLISGVFVKNLTVSNEIVASAAGAYEAEYLAAFADNENLSRIQASSLTQTSFNVLDNVNYEFYDQDQYGTCYAFSLAQMLNLSYEHKTGEHIRLSAIALALQFRNIFFNEGSYGLEIMQNSYNLDYVSEYDFPYEIAKMYYDQQTTTKDVNINFDGKEIIDVEEYYYFPNVYSTFSAETKSICVENIKKALVLDGALTMGISYQVVTSGEYLIYEPMVASVGGHAMTVVGFDDNFSGSIFGNATDGAFIIMNSWGANDQYLYMSYEDVAGFDYLMGVAGFIDADERAEEVSNMPEAYYGIQNDLFYKQDLSSNLEIGYLISNTTSKTHLSQIDLQPLYQDYDVCYFSADIKLYVGASTQDLKNGSFQYIGDYDISGGVNKIVLDTPIEVSKNFSIKIVITDNVHKYSYLDEGNQSFSAYYLYEGSWTKLSLSASNYNLVRTPYYVRALFTDGTNYEISQEDNYQTVTNNTVNFDLSSSANTEIESVGVQIFRNTTANASFTNFSMVEDEVSSEFDIVSTTSSVSLTKTTFSAGTYKVVININNGEKQFIKFLFFDDGITIHCFDTYRYLDIWEGSYKFFSLYSNSLSADIVNITIPDSYKIFRVSNKEFLESIFSFASTDITFTGSYSTDTSQRISKAEIIFENTALSTSRKVIFNFIYDKANLIFYVTKLANASHSNPQTVDAYYNQPLQNATAPNHRFVGWYEDEYFTTPATNIYVGNTGKIVYYYAKFEEKTVASVAKKASYDDVNNILTITLDFSNYNLTIYDTILFYDIRHTFKSVTIPENFNILKSAIKNNKYEYKVYVEPQNMNAINTITFDMAITRWDYREQVRFYDTLSQSVSVTDKVKISFTKIGNGEIYNSVTGESIESGDIYLPYGSKLDINFVPDDNHQIKRILIDGSSIINTDQYCFANLTKNYTFLIEFELITYQIDALVSNYGSLDKSPTETYERGTTVTYNFTPNEGSYLKTLQVDGVSLPTEGVTSYTFFNIQENHSIVIVFALFEYTITTTIVGVGDIGQPQSKKANHGDDVVYTFTPNAGYHLKQILIDGEEIEITNNQTFNYTFENVTQNHSIFVKFEKDVINITLIVSGNGNVSAKKVSSGSILERTSTEVTFSVEYEESLTFDFVGDEGYKVGSILVNGATQTSQDSITINTIIDDVEIKVFFVLKTYDLKVIISGSGVTNHGNNIVRNHGESVSYTFTPSTGYEIQKVIVDGEDKGIITGYTFENITSNHTINITFVIQQFEIKWYNYNGTLIETSLYNYGTVPTATFENPTRPAEGNYVYDFVGWNTSLDGLGFEIAPATGNISYYAQFYRHLVQFAIKVSAGTNGEISPKGNTSNDVMVEYGANQTFVFIPNHGYHVSKVYVDEKAVEDLDSYTFENVTNSHTISVVFKRNDFKATVVSDDEKGTVSGSRWFENGERATYKITPKEGYIVESVFVNGKKVNCTNNTIVVENVGEDLEIVVSYVSAKDSSTFANLTKTLIIGGIGITIIGGGFAVVYFVKIKGKAKNAGEDDEYDEN